MADIADVQRRAEAASRGKLGSEELVEKAPPRPSDVPGTPSKVTGRADVNIRTDSKEQVHLDLDTHESVQAGRAAAPRAAGRGGGWPKDADEWKSLLSKAAPWLAAAAIAAATAYSYAQQRENGESVGTARRQADSARGVAEVTKESTKHGWFGLKRRSEEATEDAGDKVAEAGRTAGKKADEAKRAASRAADRTSAAASDATGSAKRAAGRAGESVRGTAEGAKDAVRGTAEGTKDAARGAAGRAAGAADRAGQAVKGVAEGAKEAAEDTADRGFFMWKAATRGVREKYRQAKHEASHVADEAADAAKWAAHDVAENARAGAAATREAAHDAAEWTKDKAQDAGHAASRAGHAVEDTAVGAVSKVVAEAGAAEEVTGRVMREGGARVENAGRQTRQYYGSETPEPDYVAPKRRKFLGIF